MYRITRIDARVTSVATRIPFRYGIAEMTRAPHVVVEVALRSDDGERRGWASEHLPPKWFIKDPALPFADEVRILTRSILAAAEAATTISAASPFTLTLELDRAQRDWAARTGTTGLVAGLGVALVERAVLDASCRLLGRPFAEALDSGALGFDPSLLHPELRDAATARPTRRRAIAVRHTVGLADPLLDSEVADDPGDGLPVSVESAIRRYGVKRFKIKTVGDAAADIDRIGRLLDLCARRSVDARFTIDGNESMRTAEHFADWSGALLSEPSLAPLRERLDAVEQPLHRDVALDPSATAALAELRSTLPVIIDESDDRMDTVRRAMDLGYAGGTYKGCKGVFRGLANGALVRHRGASGARTVLTAEDLSTVPPLTVPQDLVVASALGLEHIERNGHHYFARFAPLDAALAAQALALHEDLYEASPAGPRLRIDDGAIQIGTALEAPFGLASELDVSALPALTEDAAAAATERDPRSI